jgi:hypothetical protein
MPAMSPPCRAISYPLPSLPWPWCPSSPPRSSTSPSTANVDVDAVASPENARPELASMPLTSRARTPWTSLATRRSTSTSSPWPHSRQVEHHRATTTPPDTRKTRPWTAAAGDDEHDSVAAAVDTEAMCLHPTPPDRAVAANSFARNRRTVPRHRLAP